MAYLNSSSLQNLAISQVNNNDYTVTVTKIASSITVESLLAA